jgi:hypothetical protein
MEKIKSVRIGDGHDSGRVVWFRGLDQSAAFGRHSAGCPGGADDSGAMAQEPSAAEAMPEKAHHHGHGHKGRMKIEEEHHHIITTTTRCRRAACFEGLECRRVNEGTRATGYTTPLRFTIRSLPPLYGWHRRLR